MDEDVKANHKAELDSNGEQSNQKKVELDNTVQMSNKKVEEFDVTVEMSNKKVDLDSTVKQSNEKEIELDATVEMSNKKVELDSTIKQSNKEVEIDATVQMSNKKAEFDSPVKQSNEKEREIDATVEISNKEVELHSTVKQSNENEIELDSAVKKSNKRTVEPDSVVEQSNKRKKPKEVAIFGNYRHYYGYRIDQGMEEDPRIKVFKREWFEGRDCLDIGCNSGLITITIAKKFCCRSICGIDIDSDRIEDSYWNLKRIVKMSSKKKTPSKAPESESSNRLNNGSCSTQCQSEDRMEINNRDPSSSNSTTLFDKVSFRKENFVLNKYLSKKDEKCYDTIICLSVTKWIQLNWGDEGLITLFSKIWRLLRPGGIFILEPQPWKSYSSNRQVSQVARQCYNEIELFPSSFQEILLDKIGFRRVEDLTRSLSCNKSGFQRPILAFWK